jgi:asparagine synthase (glutamine-hydrolysing)
MCGICGVVAMEGTLPPAVRHAVPAMARAIAHRGPDGHAIVDFPGASLGHRRLAIIDRAGGAQPMANEDDTLWVVFNGEIYNHRELRRHLESRGHRFRTTSDTETILHAYEEYGARCVDHFEGMFAFALYDKTRHEFFAARDRIGKKPLFYGVFGGVFHFASEIKAIQESPLWVDDVDLSALEGYLSLGYFLAPSTIYRQVRSLGPAQWLSIRNGRVETQSYWDVKRFDDDSRSEPEIVRDITETLGAATRERLESEVPLGAFLSGGIDSGLIVAFMSDVLGTDVVTTSVGFSNRAHNELEAAGKTAERLRTRHYAETLEPDLAKVLDTVTDAFDQPFADASAIPTYYVSAMARRHVTVALTGDGGDEAFGGYGFRYIPHALEHYVRANTPPLVRSWLGGVGERWPRTQRLPRVLRWGSVLENIGREPEVAYYSDLCFLKPTATRGLLGLPRERPIQESPVYEAVTEPYKRCPSHDVVQKAEYADLKVYLPNDVLVKVDRMSMASSLEVRCPLLDRRVVELAFQIPRARKMPGLRTKYLLRRIARDRLPPEVVDLPKRGFSAPVGSWIAGAHARWFREDVFGSNSFVNSVLDVDVVKALFDDHVRGGADHSYALWAVWMLERWARRSRSRAGAAVLSRSVS